MVEPDRSTRSPEVGKPKVIVRPVLSLALARPLLDGRLSGFTSSLMGDREPYLATRLTFERRGSSGTLTSFLLLAIRLRADAPRQNYVSVRRKLPCGRAVRHSAG